MSLDPLGILAIIIIICIILCVCESSWTNESVYSAVTVSSIICYEMNRLENVEV